jgi:hypothetical protein
MREGAARAAEGRRKSRREEFRVHTRLAELLQHYLDPRAVFWTSLENHPRTLLSGLFAKRRGVKSGLPDLMVICGRPPTFLELKAAGGGRPSPSQEAVRQQLTAVGCTWLMARSVRAALEALHRSGVPFKRPWKSPELLPWEGPFDGSEKRLPRHPAVAARQREYARRWRERKRARGLAVRDDDGQPAAAEAAEA